MTPVEFHFVLPRGEPMANATVDIQLGRASHTGHLTGITMPRPISVTTDAQGKVVLNLWPSSTAYYVQVMDPASEAGIFYKFLVPEVPVGSVARLQDLVIDAPMSGVFYDDTALLVIHDAKANALASKVAAAASAAAAAAAVVDMQGTIQTALDAAAAAQLSAFNASTKAAESAVSAVASASSATAAQASEATVHADALAAAAHASAADASKVAGAASAAAADASKVASAGSATSAATSATTATNQAIDAAASAAAALAARNAANTSQANAAAEAAAALASKNAADASATNAATSTTNADASAVAAAASAQAAADIALGNFVLTFNGRRGDVTLGSADVTTALGFTPYNATNPAGYITAAGSITGNAATATKLATPRTINGVAFDGSAAITVADATKLPLTGGNLTGPLSVAGAVTASGAGGFASATYQANQRNPIWRFGDSDGFGLSYFQGTAGQGGQDAIGFHFGTATAAGSKFTMLGDGRFFASGQIYAANSNLVWHAGNLPNADMLMFRGTIVGGAGMDASPGNGIWNVNQGGYSAALLSWNVGGSTSTVQLYAEYQGNLSWRNKTDSNAWTNWKGIWHTENFDPGAKANTTSPTFYGVGINIEPGDGKGINFWSSSSYSISMGNAGHYHYADVTDYSMRFTMDGAAGRGFVWGVSGGANHMSLNTGGTLNVAAAVRSHGGWFYTRDDRGWFNETHLGGIHMSDGTWIRTYGSKSFYCDQTIQAGGDVIAYSDERLKTNWRTLPDDFVAKLARLKMGIYDRLDTKLTQVGVSAQELQKVLPDAVRDSADGYLSVVYGNAAMASAVELARYVVALEKRLCKLERTA